MTSFDIALESRDDLKKYGNNAHMLYALELYTGAEDIHSIAANALTDGPNDKKIDLLYLSRETGQLIIAQGYYSQVDRECAKGNKASDLSNALAWLISTPLDKVPEEIRPQIQEARSAIKAGDISQLHIWYVHNLPENDKIKTELLTVEHQAKDLIQQNYSEIQLDFISAKELGRDYLAKLYEAQESSILIDDKILIKVPGAFEVNGDDWSAVVTSVPGSWLYEIYKKYPSLLFSANVRGFMGSRKKDQKINNKIKETAASSPSDFWVYNNGLTALVHDFVYHRDRNELEITGISIVNGAQTTGSIGSASNKPKDSLEIQARFIKSNNAEKIKNITTFNNSQNKVIATDFRSNDKTQERLRDEFKSHPGFSYFGGRRDFSNESSGKTEIPTETCAQALCAFHGTPWVAYHGKSEIWESNDIYEKIFSDITTARHIIFVFALQRAIEEYKLKLSSASANSDDFTENHKKQLAFLRRRGSTFLLMNAISSSMETITNRKLPRKGFEVSFGSISQYGDAVQLWLPVVETLIAFYHKLEPALDASLTNRTKVKEAVDSFTTYLNDILSFSDETKNKFTQIKMALVYE